MNAPRCIWLFLLLTLGFIVGIASSRAASSLGIRTYSGISITGTVGAVYAIQATTNVAQSNSWTCLTFLRLPATNHVWVDPAAIAGGQHFYRTELVTQTNMSFIPAGTFLMGTISEGGRFADEAPQTRVTLTRGFFIGQHEVTQGEYQSVMNTNPSYFTLTNSTPYSTNQPVEAVTWADATNYCAKLTQRERAAGRIPLGSRFRLPTEAEWEYAYRADSSTRFYYGQDNCNGDYGNLPGYAWYAGNNNISTRAIEQLAANRWGLYDMSGNVYEWCLDWYGPYLGGDAIDPQGAATGTDRVLRGGGFGSTARFCRAACRSANLPNLRFQDVGFRVVLGTGSP